MNKTSKKEKDNVWTECVPQEYTVYLRMRFLWMNHFVEAKVDACEENVPTVLAECITLPSYFTCFHSKISFTLKISTCNLNCIKIIIYASRNDRR